MILLENIDGKIWNIETKVIDMAQEYQQQGNLTINLNCEGPCCESLGLYSILDHMCEKFNWDKKKITIETANRIEKHDEYNIVLWPSDDINWADLQDLDLTKQDDLKHAGLLVGRSNCGRLWLSGWIFKHYRDQTMMSFHFDPAHDYHLAHIGLDDMLRWQATLSDVQDAMDLITRSPLTLDGPSNYPIIPPENLHVIRAYKNFFLDIVMETYFSGNTFFMTEKIVRPMMARTPFIVFASPEWLLRLKELGFQTFERWWSEAYDDYSEGERIVRMQTLLRDIYAKSSEELLDMLHDMRPVLEHNRNMILNNENIALC